MDHNKPVGARDPADGRTFEEKAIDILKRQVETLNMMLDGEKKNFILQQRIHNIALAGKDRQIAELQEELDRLRGTQADVRPSYLPRWRVSWDGYDGGRCEAMFCSAANAAAEAILRVTEDYDNVSMEEIPKGGRADAQEKG